MLKEYGAALKWLLAAIVAALLFGGGWYVRDARCDATAATTLSAQLQETFDAQVKLLDALRDQSERNATARASEAKFHAEQRARLAQWLVQSTAGCELDAAGVELWNAANAGPAAAPDAERRLADPVPTPTAPERRQSTRDGGQSRRGADPARRLPAPSARAGAVGSGGGGGER